jgi:hypothetical protein
MLFKKVTIFSAPPPIQNIHQWLPEGDVLPFVWGFKGGGSPLIAKNSF